MYFPAVRIRAFAPRTQALCAKFAFGAQDANSGTLKPSLPFSSPVIFADVQGRRTSKYYYCYICYYYTITSKVMTQDMLSGKHGSCHHCQFVAVPVDFTASSFQKSYLWLISSSHPPPSWNLQVYTSDQNEFYTMSSLNGGFTPALQFLQTLSWRLDIYLHMTPRYPSSLHQ